MPKHMRFALIFLGFASLLSVLVGCGSAPTSDPTLDGTPVPTPRPLTTISKEALNTAAQLCSQATPSSVITPAKTSNALAPVLTLTLNTSNWVETPSPFIEASNEADIHTLICTVNDGAALDIKLLQWPDGKTIGENQFPVSGGQSSTLIITYPQYGFLVGTRTESSGGYISSKEVYDWLFHVLGVDDKTIFTSDFPIMSQAFSSDGGSIITVSANLQVDTRDVATGLLLHSFSVSETGVDAVLLSPSGDTVVTSDQNGTLKLWSTLRGQVVFTLPHVLDINLCYRCIAFSPDGKLLLTAVFSDALATVWDVGTGRSIDTITLDDRGYADAGIDAVAFSSDGNTLALGTDTGVVRLWNIKANQEEHKFNGQGHATDFVAFSPDGKLLLDQEGNVDTARLWDLASGQEIQAFPTSMLLATFSPDSKMLAIENSDRMISFWSIATGKLVHLLDQGGEATAITFSSHGDLLSVIVGNSLKLWDLTKQ